MLMFQYVLKSYEISFVKTLIYEGWIDLAGLISMSLTFISVSYQVLVVNKSAFKKSFYMTEARSANIFLL